MSGEWVKSVPGMIGAVLGGMAAGALIGGIGLTGGLAVVSAAALGSLLGWAGENIGDWIADNWSKFEGFQQISDAWDILSDHIGDFVNDVFNSLDELWDNPTDWLDDLLNIFNQRPIDPILIDLDGDGIELTALNRSSSFFDLDGDGFRERAGWVNPDDGLLALDRDGNGRIEGIAELFFWGDFSSEKSGWGFFAEEAGSKILREKDFAIRRRGPRPS